VSECVGFNVPLDTEQVISETKSRSSQPIIWLVLHVVKKSNSNQTTTQKTKQR